MIKKNEEQKPISKIVFKNVLFNQSSRVVSKILGAIFVIILARILKPELFGLYGLVFSVVFIFLTFTDLGINTALTRYVAANINNKKKAASYAGHLIKLKIFVSFGFAILLLLVAKPLAVFVFKKPEIFLLFLISSIYIVITAFIDFLEALFYAFNEVNYVFIKEIIFQIVRIVFVFSIIYILSKTLPNIFFALILTNLVVLLFVIYITKKRYSFLFELSSELSKKEKRKILSYIFYLTLANLSLVFFTYVDTVMLGIFIEAEYVGFYKAAYTIATSLAGLLAITAALFPIFSQLQSKKLNYAFEKVFNYSLILSLPIAFGLIFTAKPLIGILYGVEYIPSVLPLYALSLLVLSASFGLYPTFFSAIGKPEWPAKMMVVASVLNIVLNFILIKSFLVISPLHATLGSAIATVVSNFFFFTSLFFIARKKFKLSVKRSIIYKPLLASIIMVLFLILFNKFIGLTWPLAIFEIILGAFVYFSILFLIKGIKKEDFVFFKFLIRK